MEFDFVPILGLCKLMVFKHSRKALVLIAIVFLVAACLLVTLKHRTLVISEAKESVKIYLPISLGYKRNGFISCNTTATAQKRLFWRNELASVTPIYIDSRQSEPGTFELQKPPCGLEIVIRVLNEFRLEIGGISSPAICFTRTYRSPRIGEEDQFPSKPKF